MFLVSVILPAYNAGKTIKRCIKSILNQTYCNFELIIVNDGSQDDTKVICKKFKRIDKRILVVNKANGGVSAARNSGMQVAKGFFVAFVDSDDFLSIGYLEKMINDYYKTSADLIIHGFNAIGFNPKKITIPHYIPKILERKEFYTLFETYKIYKNGYVFSKLYLNSIIKQNEIKFDEEIVLHEDTVFVLTYLQYCQKVYLNSIEEYNYVNTKKSLSKKDFEFISVYKTYLEFLKFYKLYQAENPNIEFLVCYKTYMNRLLKNSLVSFYKSKPENLNSIDFLCSIPNEAIENFKDYQFNSVFKQKMYSLFKQNKIKKFNIIMTMLYNMYYIKNCKLKFFKCQNNFLQ